MPHHCPSNMSDESMSSDNMSTGLGMGLGAVLRGGDDFVEQLCTKLIERHLRENMLGLPAEPVTLGRWELWKVIDQGAMGAVFQAFDPKLERQVAIKILLYPRGANHQELRVRMATEARAMAHIGHHTNVIPIHDFHEPSPEHGDDQAPSYLVMDFVDGSTLGNWQQSEHPTWQMIVEKYTQAALGLAHIHRNNLVHRDIKPANILVRKDGVVLIGDLGLVHSSDATTATEEDDICSEEVDIRNNAMPANPFSTRITRDGARIGTLAYMAPEQLREGQTSPLSDQFSFFVSLYQALYGHLPYQARSHSALLEAMEKGPLSCRRGALNEPSWLRKIIDRGLAISPEERHADMNAAVAALHKGMQPKNRDWRSIGVFSSLTLGLGALLTFTVLHRNDPCQTISTLPEWSQAKQAIAHFGFLSSGVQGADLSWDRFESVTNEFARSWRGTKIETCTTIEQQNEQTDQTKHSTDEQTIATSRDQCLNDTADLLGAFMHRYQNASASDVYSSDFAAYELQERLRSCSRNQFVGSTTTHDAPADKPALDLIRKQLADAFVLEIGGDLDRAVTLASSALDSAHQLQAAGIEAQAGLRLGRIYSLLRRDDEALALLSDARKMALISSRDDIVADAMIELIKLLALGLEDFKRADAIAEILNSQIRRLGEGELRRLAAAAEALGLLSREKGATRAAIKHHRRALEIRQSTDNSPIGDRVRSLLNLANALSDLESDEQAITEARTLYTEALELARTLGPKHPLIVDAERTSAAFFMQLGEFEQARTHSESALVLATEIYGDPSPQAAVLHVHLGTIFA
ncbi:MAG TPA: hypothetical protein ENJ18_04105, partial [Nannocystis exedens]|nr:hypothetical protein [Nannocystis exedens]